MALLSARHALDRPWRRLLLARFSPRLAIALAVTFLLSFAWSGVSHSAETAPGLTPRAMPGVLRLGLPAPAPEGAAAAHLGVGWIEPTGQPPVGATRLLGGVAFAYAPLPQLDFGLDVSGRADFLSTPEENAVGEPRLTARGIFLSRGPVRLGVEADVRFVGVSAPSIDWRATSPSIALLAAWTPTERTWIGGSGGFHADRSAQAIEDPGPISGADRITLGASSAPAVELGLGISHRLTTVPLELLGELTADLLVGSSAPPVGQSPLRLSAGARYQALPQLALLAALDVGLSARPASLGGDTLMPIEPRLAGQLAISYSFSRKAAPPPPPAAEPAPPPPPAAAPAPPQSSLRGRVVDEAGQGLADLEVTLELPGGARSVRTFADGHFEFPEVPDEAEARVLAAGAGFDPAEATLAPGRERQIELVLYAAVPAGQVRGTVVDLKGNPVRATITVDPGNSVLEVNPDGSFSLELKPGEYRLRAEHPDFAPQGRVIVVVERGVVILHIALSP